MITGEIKVHFPEEVQMQLNRIEEMLHTILMGDPEQLLTGPQVEALLYCKDGKLKKLRDNGEIPFSGEGKGIRYRRADVLAYMKRNNIQLLRISA